MKEAVLPFDRFPDVDTILGPEMRSTGEVMGIDRSFGLAFAKSQAAAGNRLPDQGTVFLSLADRDKPAGLLGGPPLRRARVRARRHRRHRRRAARRGPPGRGGGGEGGGAPTDGQSDAVDLISSGKVDLVVNTPRGRGPRADGDHIRRAATRHGSPASPPSPPRSPRPPGSRSGRAASRPCARCRSTTATASSGWRSEVRGPATVDLRGRGSGRSCCRTRSSRRRARSATATRWRGSATRASSARSR